MLSHPLIAQENVFRTSSFGTASTRLPCEVHCPLCNPSLRSTTNVVRVVAVVRHSRIVRHGSYATVGRRRRCPGKGFLGSTSPQQRPIGGCGARRKDAETRAVWVKTRHQLTCHDLEKRRHLWAFRHSYQLTVLLMFL